MFDPVKADVTFDVEFPKAAGRSFDDLALGEFNQMLLHNCTWPRVSTIFDLDKESIRRILDGVRDTRNTLFHFRAEITPIQRSQLKFCNDWLNRQKQDVSSSLLTLDIGTTLQPHAPDTLAPNSGPAVPDRDSPEEVHPIAPVEDANPSDSRYVALAQYLQELPDSEGLALLSFDDVNKIIGDSLPTSARQHRSWWANDSVSHVQSRQWLDAGWRVHQISITDQRVSFARIRERDRQYIDFFSNIIVDLEATEGFPLKPTSPKGLNWQTVAALPRIGTQQAIFSFAFAFHGRYRAELYIDTWDTIRNKKVFDQLHASKLEIETAVGGSLQWDRLDSRRACRIALYHDGSINGSPEELAKLRAWSRDAMIRLHHGIADIAEEIILESMKD